MGLVALAAILTIPSVAAAAVDPYGADDLDLVSYADQVRAYASGLDTWEVWACDTSNGGLSIDPVTVANLLNAELDPYFIWLSDSKYRPVFAVGGTVAAGNTTWPDDPFDMQAECRSAVSTSASGTSRGVLIVVDVP